MSLGRRGSIRREIVLFGIAYAVLGVSCVALAFADLKEPLPAYGRFLLIIASGLLLCTAYGAIWGRRWTWRLALSVHLAMLLAGVATTAVEIATREESQGLLGLAWIVVQRAFGIALYSAFALFWLRPAVRAELSRSQLRESENA